MGIGPSILLAGRDRPLARTLERILGQQGCRLSTATDGKATGRALREAPPDLLLIDAAHPEGVLPLCRDFHARFSVPIIVVAAFGDAEQGVAALEAGADDYVGGPFRARELLARMRAVQRRVATAGPGLRGGTLEFAGWTIDIAARALRDPAGAVVDLTDGQFRLLSALCHRPGRVLSREQILDLTHGATHAGYDRSVDILVSRLRRKIERDPRRPTLIRTVRNGGYLLAVPVRPP